MASVTVPKFPATAYQIVDGVHNRIGFDLSMSKSLAEMIGEIEPTDDFACERAIALARGITLLLKEVEAELETAAREVINQREAIHG